VNMTTASVAQNGPVDTDAHGNDTTTELLASSLRYLSVLPAAPIEPLAALAQPVGSGVLSSMRLSNGDIRRRREALGRALSTLADEKERLLRNRRTAQEIEERFRYGESRENV